MSHRLLQPPPQARAAPSTGTLYLYDAIGSDGLGGIGEREVIDSLNELRSAGHTDLEVRISSPGGSVFAGLAIYRAISEWKGKKTCIVDGWAASAASFIMLACDRVLLAPQSLVMIHKAWATAVGNDDHMEAMRELLRKADDSIISIYSTRTKMDPDQARQYMAAETWFDPQQAVAAGLASSIIEDTREPVSVMTSDAAVAVIATFRNAPARLPSADMQERLHRFEMRMLRDKLSKASGRGGSGSSGTRIN